MSLRTRMAARILVAIVLLVTAVVLWADETQFGWFAYAPLPDEAAASLVLMTGRRELAVLVGAVGLLLLGFAVGYGVARRPQRVGSP
ncbi:hypothetical protein [Intrasporangium mesophilum]